MKSPATPVEAILCPTDFSIFSSRAMRHAVTLARSLKARLKVAHVLPTPVLFPAGPPYPHAIESLLPQLRSEAEAELRRFAGPAVEARLALEIELREGQPWRAILEMADQLPASLVVMGTHGRSGLERLMLGSVTEKLLRLLPCPVLTVCHEEGRTWESPGLIRRVLCATDLRQPSLDATALGLLEALQPGASLTLLHVFEELPGMGESLYFPGAGVSRDDLLRSAAERLHRAGRAVEQHTGVKVTERLECRPHAYRRILEVAAEERADLLVLGPGSGSRARFLLGSNSQHVVREATCPVLTLRPLVDRRPARRADAAALGLVEV